jgi:hypothetical protein
MTRNIDFSEPLDEADEAYVRDRPWLIQDAQLRGETVTFASEEEFTLDDSDDDAGTTPAGAPGVDVTNRVDDDPDQTEDSEDGDESATGDDASDESEDDAETDADDEEADDVPSYDEWDYAALKEEAGNRGLTKSGSKEQLIARLTEDDQNAE